jgi:hypothetical protein
LLLVVLLLLQQQGTQPHLCFCRLSVGMQTQAMLAPAAGATAAGATAAAECAAAPPATVPRLANVAAAAASDVCVPTLSPSTVAPNMYRAFHWHSLLL